jgi:hypothetical protein
MEEAKSATGQFELKTGVKHEDHGVLKTVIFRELTGIEEDILASRKMLINEKMNQVVANCVVKLGPIDNKIEIEKLIKRATSLDRTELLIAIRCFSLGNNLEFESECPSCEKKDKKNFDLTQIKATKYPDIDKLIISEKLPSGKTVRFKVADANVDIKI